MSEQVAVPRYGARGPASPREPFRLFSQCEEGHRDRPAAAALDLIPGIYLYWVLELGAVVSVLGALALRRPPRWRVTRKRTVPSAYPDRHLREPIPLAFLVNAYIPAVLAGNGSDVRWGPAASFDFAHGAGILAAPKDAPPLHSSR